MILVYTQAIKVEIPIVSTQYRGFSATSPIKLMYVSNIPVILASALTANAVFIRQIMWANFNPRNNNPLFNFLAQFDPQSPSTPMGGIVYYITPPRGLDLAAQDPIRAVAATYAIGSEIELRLRNYESISEATEILGNYSIPATKLTVYLSLGRFIWMPFESIWSENGELKSSQKHTKWTTDLPWSAAPDTVICSIDKDLRQIPGQHYNPVKDTFEVVTSEEAARTLYASMLIGDSSDNLRGIDGLGPVKSGRLLHGLSPEEAHLKVSGIYEDAGRDFLHSYRLFRLLRSEEEYREILNEIAISQGEGPEVATDSEGCFSEARD